MLKSLKLSVKILLLFLFISIITAGTVGTVSFIIGRNTLKNESFKKLTAIRELKANEIENYFQQILDQVISFSESRTVIEATMEFTAAFNNLEAEHNYTEPELSAMDSTLNSFYQTEFFDQLLYRDSTINYFSLPKSELNQSRELWQSVWGNNKNEKQNSGEFPSLDPSGFSGDIKISGSSTAAALVTYIADLFVEDGASGKVMYESAGTLKGIQDMVSGSYVDMVGSSRNLSTEEMRLFTAEGLKPLEFRIGTDALVVVVSEQNYLLNNLSSEELAQVFTTASNWSEINPDWPDRPIRRFIPTEGSGSYYVFSEVMLDGDQQALLNRPNTHFIEDGSIMNEQLLADPWTIAFFSYNYFDQASKLKILDIDGVNLANTSIRNNTYSLTRPLYLVTTENRASENSDLALLLNYFLNVVDDALGTDIQKADYWPQQTSSRILQYKYIANNPLGKDKRADLTQIEDESTYNRTHSSFHPIFKNYLERFGYYDIFLIDDKTGTIVYSVEKEVDFATDILQGPHGNTGISEVFQKAVESEYSDVAFVNDFSPYLPSYNAPASFIAVPIFVTKQRIGVLVVQLPVDKINNIMTDGYQWEKVGLGKTGETYLVGEDFLLRNQSRFLIEDADNYFRMLEEINLSHQIRSKIKKLNNTIGIQPVVTQGTQAALNGETDTEIFKDYRGVEVLSAYKPLSLEQLNWVIMSEIDKTEAFAPINRMLKSFLVWFFIVLLIILIISLLFARSISHPLLVLTERAAELSDGDLEQKVEINRTDELGILGKSFEHMRISLKSVIGDLQSLNQHLEEKVEKRTEDLNASNQQIKGIINSLADALIIIDVKGTIEFYSPSAVKLFQFTQNEITGKNIRELMPSPHHEQHDSYMENYYRTGVAKVVGIEREVYAKRKDGTTFPARLMISEIKTDKVRKFVGLVGDLTDRKEAEKKLRRQSAAMQAAANGIMITETDGTIQMVNQAFTKLTGFEANEVIGENPRILNSGKQDKAYFKKLWDTILSGESWREEIINKRKDGTLYDEEQTITPVFGDDNKITNFVGIKQDVTERKQMEAIVLKAKKRMESELNVAKEIQMSMLPLIFPAFPQRKEIDLYASLIPAREVGGDFYDFFYIDEIHFCFVVGDVSGKGVPAALMMAVTKTLLKSRASNNKSTASILTHVNDELAKDNDTNMFITIFMGILDTVSGEMVYSNAGHNPSFVLSASKDKLTKLTELHGPVVGALPGIVYKEAKIQLNKNDGVLAYTDGITEAMNSRKELFSDSRLEAYLKEQLNKKPDELVLEIIDEVKHFENGQEQTDDITVLSLRYKEAPQNVPLNQIEVEIKNKLDEIAKVQEQFKFFSEKNKIPKDVAMRFNIVFDEMLSNIISYAYTDDKTHTIKVTITLSNNELEITITDDGILFNPFEKTDPDTSLLVDEREIGGLGIHLVKKMVDNHNYKRDENNNISTLRKQL